MNLEDEFRLLVGGYYGVSEIDEYDLKVYILKNIEDYIRDFIQEYPISNFDYQKVSEELELLPLKMKLQDSLLVLNKVKAPMELILLVRNRLNELKND